MSELRKPYIKLWAAETLLSDDMASLSDHDERVFWRLMMVASLEEERWITRETPGLHRKCVTTAAKFTRAIANLEAFGMVKRLDDGFLLVVNGRKWNEDTDRKRYPSDSPEATRERQSRSRERTSHEHVTTRDKNSHDLHKEEEKEKEKEEEQENAPTRLRAPAASVPSRSPKKPKPETNVTDDYLKEIQPRHPTVDVREVFADASNRKVWDGYKNQRRALAKYIGWAEEKVAERNNKVPPPRVITFDDDLPLPEGMALPEVRFQR